MKISDIQGLKVSGICLGTMTFGTPVAEREAIRLVHYALDRGINFIDTANMYEGYARVAGSSGGVAEEIVGKALCEGGKNAVVATKLGMKVGSAPEDEFCSPAAIRKQLDLSLHRLRREAVDLYYLHRHDSTTDPRDIARTMGEMLRAGKIRAWSVSNYTKGQLADLLQAARDENVPPPVACQPALSLLKQEALGDIIPYCVASDIAVIPYQILQGGLLTGKYRLGSPMPGGSRGAEKPDWLWDIDKALDTRLGEIQADADVKGLTMAEYATAWVLSRPGVASAIIGVTKEKQIDDAVRAAGARI